MNVQVRTPEIVALDQAAPPRQRWRTSHASLRIRLYVTLLALDLACLVFSMFAANWLYRPGTTASDWLVVVAVLAPVYVGAALNVRAYSSILIDHPGQGVRRALQSLALATGITVLVGFLLKNSAEFSRGVIAIGFTLSFLSLGVARWWFLHRANRLMGGAAYSVALIVDGLVAPEDLSPFSAVLLANDELDPNVDSPVLFDRLATALRDMDRVVVSCPADRRASWVRMLQGSNVRSEVMATELVDLAPLAIDRCAGVPTIVVAEGPLGRFDAAVKRIFDVTVALIGCVLLAPLALLVAILIKHGSKGPVFFVQTRIGQGNRMFRMLKFRSMQVEQSDGAGHRSAGRDDDRVTPIGRFLRKTSLDELPQLLNVLRGDMSIVGPRPHALGSRAENLLFWEADSRYWHRHAAKPGLTGLAQVRGFRGATERVADLTNRVQADLEYLHNWTIWRDLKIVGLTFRVLIHRNAF